MQLHACPPWRGMPGRQESGAPHGRPPRACSEGEILLRKGTDGLERKKTDSHDFRERPLLSEGHLFPRPIKGTGVCLRPEAAAFPLTGECCGS